MENQGKQEERLFRVLMDAALLSDFSWVIDVLNTMTPGVDMNHVCTSEENKNQSTLFVVLVSTILDQRRELAIRDADENLCRLLELAMTHGANPNIPNDEGESGFWKICEELNFRDTEGGIASMLMTVIKSVKYGDDWDLFVDPFQEYSDVNGLKTSLWHLAVVKSSKKLLSILCTACVQPFHVYYDHFEHDFEQRKRLEPNSVDEMGEAYQRWNKKIALGGKCKEAQAGLHLMPMHLVLTYNYPENVMIPMLEELLQPRPLNNTEASTMTLFCPNVVDQYGFSALHWACYKGFEKAIENIMGYDLRFRNTSSPSILLQDRFVDINLQTTNCGPSCNAHAAHCENPLCTRGYTPLMCAIQMQHVDAVDALFDRHCLGRRTHDLNTRFAHFCRFSPLHLACAQPVEMNKTVLMLLQHKANVNLKDMYRYSPLHLATMRGHILIVKQLVKYNANVDEPCGSDEEGETALHIAAAGGFPNIVSLLLRKGGAEVQGENSKGQTPLAHAFQYHSFLSDALDDQVEEIVHNQIESREIALLAKAEKEMPGRSEQIRNILSRVIKEKFKDQYPGLYMRLVDLFEEIMDDRRAVGSRKASQKKILKNLRMQKRKNKGKEPNTIQAESDGSYFSFHAHPIYFRSDGQEKIDLEKAEQMQAESLLLKIGSQDMLIKMLLENGGDLDHEDKNDDPAFSLAARFNWFDRHYKRMLDINNHPNELGYDNEVFRDPRTQAAVRTKYIYVGERTKALRELAYWVLFLSLLTAIAVHYSGRNSYDAISVHNSIRDIITGEEWDEVQMKSLEDVGNIDEWHQFILGPFIDGLWSNENSTAYHQVTENSPDVAVRQYASSLSTSNGMLQLLGRPRYRQLRSQPQGCSRDTPSTLGSPDNYCFNTMNIGAFFHTNDLDKTPFECSTTVANIFNWTDEASIPLQGNYGYYPNGGFSVTLPVDKAETRRLLENLQECSFLSMNTRVAIFEFTIYSRSQDLFTHAMIYLESTNAGAFHASSSWDTFKLLSYNTRADMVPWLIVEIVFLVLYLKYVVSEFSAMTEAWPAEHVESNTTPRWWCPTLVLTARAQERALAQPKEFMQILPLPRSLGLKHSICFRKSQTWKIPPYLMNPFNYLDVLIMVLIVSLVCVHVQLSYTSNGMLSEWNKSDQLENSYIDISAIIHLARARQHLLAIIIFICYCKCLEYIQVSSATAIPVLIFGKMVMKLMNFFLIFIIFILAFGFFDYVLYSLDLDATSSITQSLVLAFRGSLGDIDFDLRYKQNRSLGTFMSVLGALALVLVLLNLLIAVMNEAYEECQATAEARWCYMQFSKIFQRQKMDELQKNNNRNMLACFQTDDGALSNPTSKFQMNKRVAPTSGLEELEATEIDTTKFSDIGTFNAHVGDWKTNP